LGKPNRPGSGQPPPPSCPRGGPGQTQQKSTRKPSKEGGFSGCPRGGKPSSRQPPPPGNHGGGKTGTGNHRKKKTWNPPKTVNILGKHTPGKIGNHRANGKPGKPLRNRIKEIEHNVGKCKSFAQGRGPAQKTEGIQGGGGSKTRGIRTTSRGENPTVRNPQSSVVGGVTWDAKFPVSPDPTGGGDEGKSNGFISGPEVNHYSIRITFDALGGKDRHPQRSACVWHP